jgi:hypothetical protein
MEANKEHEGKGNSREKAQKAQKEETGQPQIHADRVCHMERCLACENVPEPRSGEIFVASRVS